MHKICRYQKYSETQHRRFPLRKFSALSDKKFSTENLYTPPLLSINFLATGNFLKHSREGFPYEIFRHCETKNFQRKILILPNPLSYSNFFGTRNQCNSKEFPYGKFRHYETENFRRKILILPPPRYPWTFSLPEISEAQQRRVPLRNFSALWDKKISSENHDTPSLLLLPPIQR